MQYWKYTNRYINFHYIFVIVILFQSRFYTIQHEKLLHGPNRNYQRVDPSDIYNQTSVKIKSTTRPPHTIVDYNGSCDSGIFNSLRSDEGIIDKGDSSNEQSPQLSAKVQFVITILLSFDNRNGLVRIYFINASLNLRYSMIYFGGLQFVLLFQLFGIVVPNCIMLIPLSNWLITVVRWPILIFGQFFHNKYSQIGFGTHQHRLCWSISPLDQLSFPMVISLSLFL